jgi:hypothetical protein
MPPLQTQLEQLRVALNRVAELIEQIQERVPELEALNGK